VTAPALIDPLAPAAAGVWRSGGVTVARARAGRRLRARRRDGMLTVEHTLAAGDLCDDLAELNAFAAQLQPAPVLALMHFPRTQDVRRAAHHGAAGVL